MAKSRPGRRYDDPGSSKKSQQGAFERVYKALYGKGRKPSQAVRSAIATWKLLFGKSALGGGSSG